MMEGGVLASAFPRTLTAPSPRLSEPLLAVLVPRVLAHRRLRAEAAAPHRASAAPWPAASSPSLRTETALSGPRGARPDPDLVTAVAQLARKVPAVEGSGAVALLSPAG